jgi:hypothetical protein
VAHRNAPLTELGRLRLAQCIVVHRRPGLAPSPRRRAVPGQPPDRPPVGHPLPGSGPGRDDRPVQPTSPQPQPDARAGRAPDRAPALEAATRTGPDRPPGPARAQHGPPGPVRCRISQLAHVDRATGQTVRGQTVRGQTVRDPIHRYEHPIPGALLHVDVKKLGNIPAGGGHRLLGRAAGERQADATPTPTTAAARSAATATRCTVTAISTPPSMTTPGLPTPRSTPASRQRPQPGSWSGPWPGSPLVASPSSGS